MLADGRSSGYMVARAATWSLERLVQLYLDEAVRLPGVPASILFQIETQGLLRVSGGGL